MKQNYNELPNGYLESINRAFQAAYSDFLRRHEGLHVLYLEIGIDGDSAEVIEQLL